MWLRWHLASTAVGSAGGSDSGALGHAALMHILLALYCHVQQPSAACMFRCIRVDLNNLCSVKEQMAVLATGPGSGKTGVLVGRMTKCIEEGVSPAEILAVTFTVKVRAPVALESKCM